jgi:serine/threonine protein kinase
MIDVKPSNIMISYTHGLDGSRNISAVCLADTEDALKLKTGEAIYSVVGNVLRRSPEAQTGTRIDQASDVWSFGVTVCASVLECPR